MVIAQALVSSVLFFMRGSAMWERQTGLGLGWARIIYATFNGLFILVETMDPWLAGLIALALWVGTTPPWWGSIDMGRNAGTWLRDMLWQMLRGLIFTVPAGVVLAAWGSIPAGVFVGLIGALAGPFWELGYRIKETLGSEIGAALLGAAIGAGLGLAVGAAGLTGPGVWDQEAKPLAPPPGPGIIGSR